MTCVGVGSTYIQHRCEACPGMQGQRPVGSGSSSQYVTVRNGSRCVDAGPGVATQTRVSVIGREVG